jgi:hypothetical protein
MTEQNTSRPGRARVAVRSGPWTHAGQANTALLGFLRG